MPTRDDQFYYRGDELDRVGRTMGIQRGVRDELLPPSGSGGRVQYRTHIEDDGAFRERLREIVSPTSWQRRIEPIRSDDWIDAVRYQLLEAGVFHQHDLRIEGEIDPQDRTRLNIRVGAVELPQIEDFKVGIEITTECRTRMAMIDDDDFEEEAA